MQKIVMILLLGVAIAGALWLDMRVADRPPAADAATYLADAQVTPPRLLPAVVIFPPELQSPTTPITLVHTWASWCPPCVTELPQLIRATQQKSPQITILALNADATPEAMEAAVNKAYKAAGVPVDDPTIHWQHDPNQRLSGALLQSRQLPETLILSGNPPHITHHLKGPVPWELLIPHLLTPTVVSGL